MIPKIIHLTWFSGDPYPENIDLCISSWKKLLPDFEIRLWTMHEARNLNISYINEALDLKKWAFASDVVRAFAVWKYGGVYMDTDIWLLRRFDEFLTERMVLFHEYCEENLRKLTPSDALDKDGRRIRKDINVEGAQIQAAMFMGEKGHPYLAEIVEYYKTIHFVNEKGLPNMGLISPMIYAQRLENRGFLYNNQEQHLKDDISIYPTSFVGGCKYVCFDNSIAIHCVDHSWKPKTDREKKAIQRKIRIKKILGLPDKAFVFKDYETKYVNYPLIKLLKLINLY